jgi:hypothetical protein
MSYRLHPAWRPCRLAWLCLLTLAALGQNTPPQRTRLILKDGSYQLVLGYQVVGDLVRFQSAERDGETEEIPLARVDLAATERWRQEHTSAAPGPVLSPELAAEEAARAALRPYVAPGLRLPTEESVLALDTYQGLPELVPLAQEGTDLNRETAHGLQKLAINPAAAAHQIAELAGAASEVKLHALQPSLYVRLGDDLDPPGGGMVIDTHGASGRATPAGGDARSGYVLERLDVRRNTRILSSFRIAWLDTGRPQPDVIELKQEPLPGGHWLRLTPPAPLETGEYALVEVLDGGTVNLNVWDFGIHPAANESYEAIKPEVRKPATLERRPE